MPVEVAKQWCGGCGYGKHAKKFEEMLLEWFPDGIHVKLYKDSGTTGNDEISVSGALVHSKKTKQQGFFGGLDTARQIEVREAIKECTLWSDLHIISFDQAGACEIQALSFCGEGCFWLLRYSTVQLYGRGGQGCASPARECMLSGDPHIISFCLAGTDRYQALCFGGVGFGW